MEPFELIAPGEGNLKLVQKLIGQEVFLSDPHRIHLVVESALADMQFDFIQGDGFASWSSLYQSKETIEYVGRANSEIIELSIAFKNHFISTWDGVGQPTMRALEFNFCYAPFVNNKAKLIAGEIYVTHDFHLTREFLNPYAKVYDDLKRFLDKVEKKESCAMSFNKRLTPEMEDMLTELLEFECNPGIYLHTFKSRLQVFLTLAMELLAEVPVDKRIRAPVNSKDIAHATRIILDGDLMDPPTIEELSRLTFTNILGVQNAFKNVHGKTIHDYTSENRIREAKKLLLDSTLTVDQIAYATGFATRQGLIKLFRKYVHCTPSEFRKKYKGK